MKFGIRIPSFNKRIAARTSWKRVVRHSLGLKAPRGFGWITNPKRAAYNRVYNRTTFKADPFIALGIGLIIALVAATFYGILSLFLGSGSRGANSSGSPCPRCGSQMVLRIGKRGQFFGCSRFPYCRGTRDYQELSAGVEANRNV
jgi:hypothetical protein